MRAQTLTLRSMLSLAAYAVLVRDVVPRIKPVVIDSVFVEAYDWLRAQHRRGGRCSTGPCGALVVGGSVGGARVAAG